MKNKYIFGGIIIVFFFAIMGYLFTQTSIKYENDFNKVMKSAKIVKVTGSWNKEKDYILDTKKNEFSFYMMDNKGNELKVIYKGTIPNNFDHATSIVVTGKYHDGVFKAKDILTKCPSKYQDSDTAKNS